MSDDYAELVHNEFGGHVDSVIGHVTAPVLIVGSTDDVAFPVRAVGEMARLIPGAQLKLYPGGHTAALLDKRFVHDVRECTSRPA